MKIKINIKIIQTIGLVILTSSLLAGGFIFYTKISQAQELLPPYRYELISKSQDPILEPGQAGLLVVTIKNTGTETWPSDQLSLTSIYFDGTSNRPSPFATAAWTEQTKILPGVSAQQTSIRPQETANFYIPIQAVQRQAIYQEIFHPYLGTNSIAGDDISWLVQVGNKLSYQSAAGKQIKIWLSDQRLWAIENNVVILDTPISSGKAGYATSKGEYTIFNHKELAYSSQYKLWMDYWMALKSNKYGVTGYGLHRLPYWKVKPGNRVEGEIKNGRLYTQGKLYEDYEHLGKPMSHGCVRQGIDPARILYEWAPNGTPVTIA